MSLRWARSPVAPKITSEQGLAWARLVRPSRSGLAAVEAVEDESAFCMDGRQTRFGRIAFREIVTGREKKQVPFVERLLLFANARKYAPPPPRRAAGNLGAAGDGAASPPFSGRLKSRLGEFFPTSITTPLRGGASTGWYDPITNSLMYLSGSSTAAAGITNSAWPVFFWMSLRPNW